MAIHEALRETLDHLGKQPTSALPRQLRMVLDISPRLSRSVLRAYHPARLDYYSSPPAPGRARAVALFDNSAPRPRGTGTAAYDIVALRVEPGGDSVATGSPMQRFLRQLRTHRDTVLPIVAESTGTLLIPATRTTCELDEVLRVCCTEASLAVTAATVHARRPELRSAREHAHQLLDLVEQLGCGPGLYRFSDLAFEYQITRPGPARDRLAAILDPLDTHPGLLTVVAHHIRTGGVQIRTAQLLGIHPMTLANRLRQIRELTGLDPTEHSARWQLHAALIAYITRPTTRDRNNLLSPHSAPLRAVLQSGSSPHCDTFEHHAPRPASNLPSHRNTPPRPGGQCR
ncbi:PucR family transcriptional regulator [Nocardia sp. alder85J]|uniref:PucR family transcriptional regulator n=1 Tax=Nocardia sp. alder85J TaxID=2862949 RepID=UPI001CD2AECD|nr:helix-turn-helix domain-containing protein [Nocardia sp. alder85J]MCX4098384.1 helix-turn-helix domain-containing protein [Nocardia sp. alder85J]